MKPFAFFYLLTALVSASGSTDTSDPSLVAHFQFNGDVTDATGHGNTGFVSNISYGPDRFGTPNRAIALKGNGNSNMKTFSRQLNLQPEFTVSVWINYTAALGTDSPRIFSTGGYEITSEGFASANRPINFNNTFAGGSGVTITSSKTVPANTWTHILAVRSQNTMVLYLNGNLVASATTTGLPDYSRGFDPEVGGNSGNDGGAYGGLIDDLRIYNRAFSPQDVSRLYLKELNPAVELSIRVSQVELSWPSSTNETYTLQSLLLNGTWKNTGDFFLGTGEVMKTVQPVGEQYQIFRLLPGSR